MHNGRDFLRQCAVDEEHLQSSFARVTERSAALQNILGFSDVNEPFAPPPSLPKCSTLPVSSSTTATTNVLSSRFVRPSRRESTIARGADLNDGPVGRALLQRQAATMSMTQLMGDDLMPQMLASHSEPTRIPYSSRNNRPSSLTSHPDLLGFKFPQPSSQENPPSSHKHDNLHQDAAPAEGYIGLDSRACNVEGQFQASQTAESQPFNPRQNRNDSGAVFNGNQTFTPTDVSANAFISRNFNAPRGHKSCSPTKTSFQLRALATPPNIFPGLQKVFEQWIRFGRQSAHGLRLLEPREISLLSVTARTIPCASIVPPGEQPEKATKLFTIAVNHDVAELKMFECEVVPETEPASASLLNMNRSPYHDTSNANPNIWTILFIREKMQLGNRGKKRGSGDLDATERAEDHVSKKRRGAQGSMVEAPVPSGNSHHSWQMIAWPSAHVTKTLEACGPVQEKGSQGRLTSRKPLAPKVVQVRQQPLPLSLQKDRRVHLKDARAHVGYNAAAPARATASRQNFNDGAPQIEQQEQENYCITSPLQRPFSRINVVAGNFEAQQDHSADVSGLSIDDDINTNSVLVYKMQRLTCLRFSRGGNIPLLAGNGVDLGYWNSFCEQFGKGETQLEFISSAEGEPVILSASERLRRRTAKGAAAMRQYGDMGIQDPRNSTKDMLAALGLDEVDVTIAEESHPERNSK
ncbi:hypothetical protein MPH_07124 [Macrophomina phaseolina MS6]|uniref:Uncharacterized protein n=1 Tax=Macrophomina phaseolina (strain MS6) TaxID=1126212 RepID=K2RZP7_MACPH|nr:hypothetical protein MPH_07124 [Macrophomina phaseolina MS6]